MAGQRKALIIANDKYSQESLQNLRAPAADADGLRRVLGDPKIGAFTVQVMRNELAHVIHAQIEELFAEGKSEDVLLVHFSGHGLKSESGELFFAATNTRPDRLGSTAVSADFVRKCMRTTRSRAVVLLLDCCYGGAFALGSAVRASGDVSVLDSFPQERLGGGRGRAVITASGAMEFAIEGTRLAHDYRRRGPSVFTAAVINGLRTGDADRDHDGWVSLDDLYDYVFDRVREQNPHQTPNRHFELAGDMYLARNPQTAAGAKDVHVRPIVLPDKSAAPVGPPSGNIPVEVAAGEAPEQPSDTMRRWQDRIETNRSPHVGLIPQVTYFLLVGAVIMQVGWAVNAAWLAVASHNSGWLTAAAATGFLSFVGVRLDRKTSVRLILRLCSLACVTMYIVSAFTGTGNWVIRGWIGSALILYVVAIYAILLWKEEARDNVSEKAYEELRRRIGEKVRETRWLTDRDHDPAVSTLLDPLTIIPAARFAIVPEGPLRFLAVAGERIALGAFVYWPSGEYTRPSGESREIYRNGRPHPKAAADLGRIDDALGKLASSLSEIYRCKLLVVVIVGPVTSAQTAGIVLHFREYSDNVHVTTPDGFADIVGPFLAEDPYLLDPRILDCLHAHLAATGREDTATSISAPSAPSSASVTSTQEFPPAGPDLRSDDAIALPDPSQ
jgi:Caspase domain